MIQVGELRLTEQEVRAWQDAAGGPILGVLAKMLEAIRAGTLEVFEAEGATLAELKVAQGMLKATQMIERASAQVLTVNLEDRDLLLGDNDDEGQEEIDVDF